MKYCTRCGSPLALAIPPGDDRERGVCRACGHVHYENPKTVAGCVVLGPGGVLLCRRAIEPARGAWTVPAGYTELEESQVQGALRETREEAGAEVRIVAPHAYLDVPHISQTYALFRAELLGGFEAGRESLEARVFGLGEIPWGEIAFPVVSVALRLLVEDERVGRRRLHVGVVRWKGVGSRYDVGGYALEEHLALALG